MKRSALIHAAMFVALCGIAQSGFAQGTVLPSSITLDPAGRVVLSFSAMGAASRLDIGATVLDASGTILSSMRAPTTVADAALSASGLLVDARSVTLGGSNPSAVNGPDLVVLRFPHSVPAIPSAVDGLPAGDAVFALLPSYPNPVRGAAPVTVSYTLAQPADVRISLLDETGRLLALLRDLSTGPGSHRTQLTLGDLPAGVYFIEFRTGAHQAVQRFLRLR